MKLCARLAVAADLGRARARARATIRAGCGSGRRCHVRYRGVDHAIACRGLVHPPLSSSTTSCCARAAPSCTSACRSRTSCATATGCWSVAGLRAPPPRSAPAARTARSRACSRRRARGGRSACRSTSSRPMPAAVARTRVGRRRRARAAAARRSARLRLERAQDRLAQRRLRHARSATEVRAAWQRRARSLLRPPATCPPRPHAELEPTMKGHSYYLFDPAHLDGAARVDADGKGGALLVGDSAGAGAAADRRGHPAGGDLGPPVRRGDPGRRAGELPRRGSPRIPSSTTTGACSGCARRAAALARPSSDARRQRRAGARRAGAPTPHSGAPARPRRRHRLRVDVLGRAPARAARLIDLALAVAERGSAPPGREGG